jgi:phospholipase C
VILAASVAAAGALAIATVPTWSGNDSAGQAASLTAAQSITKTTTPIKHVVVLFDENVSFDHYFGTYPNAANTDGTKFTANLGAPAVTPPTCRVFRRGGWTSSSTARDQAHLQNFTYLAACGRRGRPSRQSDIGRWRGQRPPSIRSVAE